MRVSLRAAVFLFAQCVVLPLHGGDGAVRYELVETSRLIHTRAEGMTRVTVAEVPIRGTCQFVYQHSGTRYFAWIGEIQFSSVSGPVYLVEGVGTFVGFESRASYRLRGLPVRGMFMQFDLRVNGIGATVDTGEPSSISSFPAFRSVVGPPFFSPLPEDAFTLVLDLRLVPEDGLLFFRRGDANSDGFRNVSDAVFMVRSLFGGASLPTCLDATDSNDDGVVDISDAVYLLQWLFAGKDPPPVPTYLCGLDETEDDLDCQGQEGCPNEIKIP